jgi:hypothetical protein
MSASVYTLGSGRTILKNGVPVAYIQRTGNSSDGHALTPAEADALAHEVVNALSLAAQVIRVARIVEEDESMDADMIVALIGELRDVAEGSDA